MADYTAYDQGLPCKNPNCSSHGRPHPNCRCYGGMSKGGQVGHFCDQMEPHQPGCEYYADGGQVLPVPPAQHTQFVDNPLETIGHAAVHHGLLGLMKDVGHAKMPEPDKHLKILQHAKDQHSWRKDPNEMPLPNTIGKRLGDHLADGDHEKATNILGDHPLSGGMSRAKLKPIMARMAGPLTNSEPHPESLRNSVEYLGSSMKGQSQLNSYVKDMLGNKKALKIKPDEKMREALKAHIAEVGMNPNILLETSGSLGHYLPAHASSVGALASTAQEYFRELQPLKTQSHPLDRVMPADKMAENRMNRQLDIANQPLLLLQNVKNGTLLPHDIATVKTLYPGLYKAIVDKAGEAVIEAQADKREIPYKQKFTLSMLLGQPMDSTMTPAAMQAIMKSQGGQQMAQQPKADPKKKATGVELKQVNKVNEMDETKLQKRQTNRKS